MARLDDLMHSAEVVAMFLCIGLLKIGGNADLLDLAAGGASARTDSIAMVL